MSNVFSKAIIFTVGAAIGSSVAWYVTKSKYEKLAQEEIAVMKEYYNKKRKELEEEKEEKPVKKKPEAKEPPVSNVVNPEVEKYVNILNNHSYNLEEEGEPATMYGPYLIAPEEFGEKDHERVFMTYYADEVLAYDDTDEVVDDIDSMIGLDSLEHFGDYEDDLLFVRNDMVRTDYEISIDTRNYSDIVSGESHPVE